MNEKRADAWMSSPAVFASPEMPLAEARKLIPQDQFRGLPVLDAGKLVGVVTRGQFLPHRPVEGAESVAEGNQTVAEVMNQQPIWIRPETSMADAAQLMLENKIAVLPVLSNDALVGVLSSFDIFRYIMDCCNGLASERKVADIMTDYVWTIDPGSSLLEADRIMSPKSIRALPVVRDGQLLGIVTRSDLMVNEPGMWGTRVDKVMAKPVLTIAPDEGMSTAAKMLLEHKIHALPVVNNKGKMVGIVTESDLFLATMQRLA